MAKARAYNVKFDHMTLGEFIEYELKANHCGSIVYQIDNCEYLFEYRRNYSVKIHNIDILKKAQGYEILSGTAEIINRARTNWTLVLSKGE